MKKLGIAVPITNRRSYFDQWLCGIQDYLKDQKVKDYCIVATEQEDTDLYYFSLAMARNVGMSYAFARQDCDYITSVDVDIIPVRSVNYGWEGMNEVNFTSFGGVKIDKDAFIKTNGYSSLYHGWGYEDTDFLFRLEHLGIEHERWAQNAGTAAICLDLERDYCDMDEARKWSRKYWGMDGADASTKVPIMIGAAAPKQVVNTTKGWRLPTQRDTNRFIADVTRKLTSEQQDRYINTYGVRNLDMSRVIVEEIKKNVHILKYRMPHIYNKEPLVF